MIQNTPNKSDTIEREVLSRIAREEIRPRPRWQFQLRDFLMWCVVALFTLGGSIAVGAIIFILLENDWEVYKDLDVSRSQHIFASIPYFWIVVGILFLLVAYIYFRTTKRGYRNPTPAVVGGFIVVSLVLAGAAYKIRLAEYAEDVTSQTVPFYDNLVQTKKNIWSKPERGLLGGTVTAVSDSDHFIIQDFDGKSWRVEGAYIFWRDLSGPVVGERLRLIGSSTLPDGFMTIEARSWTGAVPLPSAEELFDTGRANDTANE